MKALFRNLYLFFILLCPIAVQSQSTAYTDSIKKVVAAQKPDTSKLYNLISLSYSYRQFSPDSSIAYGLKSLALAEKLDHKQGIFESQIALSQSLMIAGNYPLEL